MAPAIDFMMAVGLAVINVGTLATGLFLGFLFHADFAKLGWMLLFMIGPVAGSLFARPSVHGAIFEDAALFVAVCCVTVATYRYLEFRQTRKS